MQFGSPDRLTYCFGTPLEHDYSENADFVKSNCGAKGTRTPDLLLAKEAFSQLNYGPGQTCQTYQINQISHLASLAYLPFCRVGLCGLEPQTLPLSEARSNQLS